MDAMEYECLVRMAYGCGRRGSPGADADIYRRMEHALNHLSPPYISTKSKEDLEYDYRVATAKVKGYIADAIEKAMKEIYNAEDKTKLQELKASLHMHEYKKDTIDKVIDEASDIFLKHGMQAT